MSLSREYAERWLIDGPPAAVIESIRIYINAGCTTPVLRVVRPSLRAPLQRCIEGVMLAFAI